MPELDNAEWLQGDPDPDDRSMFIIAYTFAAASGAIVGAGIALAAVGWFG